MGSNYEFRLGISSVILKHKIDWLSNDVGISALLDRCYLKVEVHQLFSEAAHLKHSIPT